MPQAKRLAIGAAVVRAMGLVLAIGLATGPSAAQDFPSRPVRIVIGFGPGSVADITARVLGNRMGQTLGQQFVVENRAGAGSNLGAEYVTRAPKDGYTLFMATIANTINPAISSLPFDFAKDLTPVSLIATSPQLLVVHPSLGVNSVQELIALAKEKPEPIHYASSGVGTLSNLSGLLMNGMAGIKLVPVPYPGSAQGVNDVLAGRVPMMFASAATVWPHVASGKLKALATTQLQRLPMAPDLPTMAEAGLQGYDAVVWMGLAGAGRHAARCRREAGAGRQRGAQIQRCPDAIACAGLRADWRHARRIRPLHRRRTGEVGQGRERRRTEDEVRRNSVRLETLGFPHRRSGGRGQVLEQRTRRIRLLAHRWECPPNRP